MLQLIESPDYEGVRGQRKPHAGPVAFMCCWKVFAGPASRNEAACSIADLAIVTTRPGCQA